MTTSSVREACVTRKVNSFKRSLSIKTSLYLTVIGHKRTHSKKWLSPFMHYWNNLLLVYINFILLYWSNLLEECTALFERAYGGA